MTSADAPSPSRPAVSDSATGSSQPIAADDPQLTAILETHRTLSRSRTDPELIDAVGSRFRAVTEASHIVGLAVRDVPAGCFRIRAVLSMPDSIDGGISVARYDWDEAPAAIAVETGPVIADLISGEIPPRTASAMDPGPITRCWPR